MSASPVVAAEDESHLEERELIQFAQAKEFTTLLFSDDFFPGGLEGASLKSRFKDEAQSSQSIAKSESTLRKLTSILDEYQEQSYLLDPYLEKIVSPVVIVLQDVVREDRAISVTKMPAIQNLYRLLYHYTKVRGYKTISHFFPHAVEDLLPTLDLLEKVQETSAESIWEMRYIQLLWLSLICLIPFDLLKFDQGKGTSIASTASRIQAVGKYFLASPGKERDAASILLARLVQRRDTSGEDFASFLLWAKNTLVASPEPSIFLATGILQTISGIIKVASPEALDCHASSIRTIVSLFSADIDEVRQASGRQDVNQPFRYSSNSIVNRYKAKMACRLGLKLLRPKRNTINTVPSLMAAEQSVLTVANQEESQTEDEDIPEEIDGYIADLLGALQDKDTIVRYSAAKGIARLCTRLPSSFVEQVSEAIVDMFTVNIVDILGKRKDFSNVSEFTWQGCCLALAELARRNLLSSDTILEKLQWVEKAFTFDIRRGAHSVGTGVRDAACYVLWAIAKAHKSETIKPMAKQLSHTLICVALLDRDISIRRAASAAYQECVGRLGLFENGIEIIRVTDFYAVGVRRNAFLECVPQVAIHQEYRDALLEHLLTRTVIHWDPAMRELGAGAIAKIALLSLSEMMPSLIKRVKILCKSADSTVIHGALCTLAELARAYPHDALDVHFYKTLICNSVQLVPRSITRPRSPAIVISAACRVLASSATEEALQHQGDGLLWHEIIDAALKRQEEDVQVAAAEAMAVISELIDCESRIRKVTSHWKSLTISQQQSNTRLLGRMCYHRHATHLGPALSFLISVVQSSSPIYSVNIETRRNAFESMSEAPSTSDSSLDEILMREDLIAILATMIKGLEDYTSDARGDVGSWVRIACLTGMRKLLGLLISKSNHPLDYWLDQSLLDTILAGYCKGMVERIDGVRAHAASECLMIHSWFADPSLKKGNLMFKGLLLFEKSFQRSNDAVLRDPSWLLPKIPHLLLISEYRKEVLKGIVLCIGGQKEMTNRTLARSLGTFLLDTSDSLYDCINFSSDLIELTMSNVKINRYFVSCIQTFNVLFEEGVVEAVLQDSEAGLQNLSKILEVACRNIKNVKSVSRVIASSQYTINLLSVVQLQKAALKHVSAFLLHTFPTVRSTTAELLYSTAQDHLQELTEEAEDILLSTRWSQIDIEALKSIVDKLMSSLLPRE